MYHQSFHFWLLANYFYVFATYMSHVMTYMYVTYE